MSKETSAAAAILGRAGKGVPRNVPKKLLRARALKAWATKRARGQVSTEKERREARKKYQRDWQRKRRGCAKRDVGTIERTRN
jgi:hypothetical protein